jgi:hypothetical protein
VWEVTEMMWVVYGVVSLAVLSVTWQVAGVFAVPFALGIGAMVAGLTAEASRWTPSKWPWEAILLTVVAFLAFSWLFGPTLGWLALPEGTDLCRDVSGCRGR